MIFIKRFIYLTYIILYIITITGKVMVTYTRCRNVSKPFNAKAGLVQLSGDVATIQVNIKAEAARLERLMLTKGVSEEGL